QPVEFVRVLAPGREPLHTVNGWPASFVADLGRGKVVITTLAARGWLRPRTQLNAKSPYPQFPNLPTIRDYFNAVSNELRTDPDRPILAPADLRPYLHTQIGYAVVGRGVTLLLFGAFFGLLAATIIALGRAGLRE